MPELQRVHKALAAAGYGSRRRCEEMIIRGQICVNGQIARLGQKINPARDRVKIDGRPAALDATRHYLLLNKPAGIICSLADEKGRNDLTQYTRDWPIRLFSVGRLDAQTTGLLLLTNDGRLAHALAHPSFGVKKTYLAKVQGRVGSQTLERLRAGVELEDGSVRIDQSQLVSVGDRLSLLKISLHSGRNRVVRRLLAKVGHEVIELSRTAFGPLRLGNLQIGQLRPASKTELAGLLKLIGSDCEGR